MNTVWLWRLWLKGGPAGLRRQAAERLGREPGDAILRHLAAARVDPDPGVRLALVRALDSRNTPEVHRLLALGLKDPDAEVRGCAAEQVTRRLLAAVLGADAGTLAELLEAGADPNAPGGEGQPPLVVALRDLKGQAAEDLASLLLEAGADPNRTGPKRITPLELTLGAGSARLVRMLLEAKADPNGRTASGLYPLRLAASSGKPELVKELLAAGAKVDLADQQSQPLLVSALKDLKDPAREEVAGLLLEAGIDPNRSDRKGLVPLEWALRERRHGLVAKLLKAKADPNAETSDGRTPLGCAAESGAIETLRCLLEAGADPNAGGKTGCPPLLAAIRDGPPKRRDEVVRALLEAGADANRADAEGVSPLEWASAKDSQGSLLSMLLAAKADPNAPTSDGKYPLIKAAIAGNRTAVRLVLEYGADPAQTDNRGLTAVDYAAGPAALEVIRLVGEASERR